MPSTPSLLSKLITDFPQFSFKEAGSFSWSPDTRTVFYVPSSDDADLLLHELSHGILGHHDYTRDVELVAMEAAAWQRARQLGKEYQIQIDEDAAETNLDTYRNWMHERSTCPACEATGYQIKKDTYQCVACGHSWRVNEARLCGLKRYSA